MKRPFFIPEFLPRLIRGAGMDPGEGGCVMQVCDYLWNGQWTDDPSCVNPVLRRVGIRVNDAVSDTERQELWLLIPRLVGTSHYFAKDEFEISRQLLRWMLIHEYGEDKQELAYFDDYFGSERPSRKIESWIEGWDSHPTTVGYLELLIDEYDKISGRKPEEIKQERWDALEKVFAGKEVRVKDGTCTVGTH